MWLLYKEIRYEGSAFNLLIMLLVLKLLHACASTYQPFKVKLLNKEYTGT